MHRLISEIVELEVVGEIVPAGDSFADASLGRICLESVDHETVGKIAGALRQKIDGSVEVRRDVAAGFTEPVRQLAEIHVRLPAARGPYVLQIASSRAIAFYERRFWLGPDVMADAMSTYVSGLSMLPRHGAHAALGVLADLEGLRQEYSEALDRALRLNAEAQLAALVPSLQRAWRLLPWTAQVGIPTLWTPTPRQPSPHGSHSAQVFVFCMTHADGGLAYQHLHRQNPYQELDEIESWIKQTYQALLRSYPAPQHTTIAAYASSATQFLEHFPRYRPVVGSNPAEEGPGT